MSAKENAVRAWKDSTTYLLTGTIFSSIYPKAFKESNIKAAVPVCQLKQEEKINVNINYNLQKARQQNYDLRIIMMMMMMMMMIL